MFCKCRKYPFDIEEYIQRMLKRSHELRDLQEKYIWLEARYKVLKATGKEMPENPSSWTILSRQTILKESNGEKENRLKR